MKTSPENPNEASTQVLPEEAATVIAEIISFLAKCDQKMPFDEGGE